MRELRSEFSNSNFGTEFSNSNFVAVFALQIITPKHFDSLLAVSEPSKIVGR